MAKKRPEPQIPENLKGIVTDVGAPVSSADVDTFGKLREIQDRSHQIRTVVKAWKDQQAQDRKMREQFATYLLVALGLQATIVNIVFILIGCGVLSFESWTAKTFIMAVFAEIAAMVLIIVKYLFTPTTDTVLRFLGGRKESAKESRHGH